MRSFALLRVLRSSVAVSAVILGAGAADAACTTANGVVTCTGANTTDSVNSGLNTAPPPSVSLIVAEGAVVTRGFSFSIFPNNPPFNGAISYTNNGAVGTTGSNVDFFYFGNPASTANTFTLNNTGTQNGLIFVSGVGGAINATNSGTITRRLDLRGAGAITLNTSGTISTNDGTSTALILDSFRGTFVQGSDGITRNTFTGGPITATISGTVGVPASGTAAFQPQDVLVRSVSNVDVNVTGRTGFVGADSRALNSADQVSSTSAGGVFTSTRFSENRTVGGDARVTVGATGQVTGVRVTAGPGAATVTVDGSVAGRGVAASAFGGDSTFRDSFSFGPNSASTSMRSDSNVNTGGAAEIDISTTGRVAGFADAFSNAGLATVRVAGQVGTSTSLVNVFSTSAGTNNTFQSQSVSRSDGTFQSSETRSASLSGSAADVSIASTGTVFGSVTARGDASASVDNAGRIAGSATATSSRSFTTASASDFSRTITTNGTGVRTQLDQSAGSSTLETLGGTATVTNRTGATIDSFVSVNGVRGALLDSGGTIRGSVFLSSVGSRAIDSSETRTTTTTVPAAGGGMTTTFVREGSNGSRTTATGGAATGTYAGTVGAPQSGTAQPTFVQISQNGNTASTAVVTGTLFAGFFGQAGGQNRDVANTFATRQVTQPNGSFNRDESGTSSDTTTQVASASSLTVGATGRLLDNGSGTGIVSLISAGGNATFTLDGGQVDGGVAVEAAAGTNRTSTSQFAATFSRAATTSGIFAPEVQQTETNSSTLSDRQAAGAAIVRVSGGTIGGDLFADGNGNGPGSLGADVVMNGNLTGSLTALASGVNFRSDSTRIVTRTGPTAVSGTSVSNSSSGPAENGGGVLVNVGGTVGGGLVAGTDVGNATVNLTGSVGTLVDDGATVLAFASTNRIQTARSFAGTSFFDLRTTSSTSTSTNTPSGGTATLNVAANTDLARTASSSIEGDVFVGGFAGSVLNIAANTRVVQRTGLVTAGLVRGDFTTTSTSTFDNGFQTGSTSTTNVIALGGGASITNAGVVGSANNQTTVRAFSVGAASVNNTGTINGSVLAAASSGNRVTTTTITDQNNNERQRRVTTNAQTAVGGAAQVSNTGLVTGGVTANGAAGLVSNSGVIRGGVTLGGGFVNFTTTTTTTFTRDTNGFLVPVTTVTSVANPTLFTQNYTLNQNGLLLGGVNVTGTTTVAPSGATVRTSNVNATVNLNNGSITLGDITADADTTTDVNLNGSGFLGIAAGDVTGIAATFQPTPSITRFAAIDSALGSTVALPSGSRVSGVRTLNKTGDGTFVIVGAPFLAATGTGSPTYTVDVETLRVSGGELQLGLAGPAAPAGVFGIRGNVENNANLVLGRRVTNGVQSAIQGINLSVLGNLTNAAAGNLIVGVNPSFVRGAPAGGNPFAPNPFVLVGPGSPLLQSTNSFVRVDGNLNLAGTLAVQGQAGALYEAGRAYDLFSVSGTYANTGTVRSSFASPFVNFALTPRSEGGRTIVSLDVVRTNFDTVATDRNAAAAAGALQATLPSVFAGLRSGAASANDQDLATIIGALDTQLTTDQAAQVFRELSSGEFYGSLSAVSTTAPFGEATDGLSSATPRSGVGIWLRPTGQFARFRSNPASGASGIDLSNYGGSIGLNYATGAGGNIGIAGGYGQLEVDADTPEQAEAETYMVGIYGAQQFGRLHFSGQAVYGSSEWDASRTLSLLGRTATSEFDSEEVRASVRAAYTIVMLPGIDFAPFARVEARRTTFDGFAEQGAGAVSLVVGKRSQTVLTPELGVRMSGSSDAAIRPFAEGSYIFQDEVDSRRRVRFAGGFAPAFSLDGVDPQDSIKAAIGVAADIASGTLFVRGDYHSGGDQQVGSVRAGLLFTF